MCSEWYSAAIAMQPYSKSISGKKCGKNTIRAGYNYIHIIIAYADCTTFSITVVFLSSVLL